MVLCSIQYVKFSIPVATQYDLSYKISFTNFKSSSAHKENKERSTRSLQTKIVRIRINEKAKRMNVFPKSQLFVMFLDHESSCHRVSVIHLACAKQE